MKERIHGILLVVLTSSGDLGHYLRARSEKELRRLDCVLPNTYQHSTVCVPTESCRAMVKTERLNKTFRWKLKKA